MNLTLTCLFNQRIFPHCSLSTASISYQLVCVQPLQPHIKDLRGAAFQLGASVLLFGWGGDRELSVWADERSC